MQPDRLDFVAQRKRVGRSAALLCCAPSGAPALPHQGPKPGQKPCQGEAKLIQSNHPPGRRIVPRTKSRIPEESTFFNKVVPLLMIVMALVMGGLILFAAGVLLGLVTF